MRPLCLLPVLALTAALAAPAAAQGRSAFAGDARLDKPVTVRWKKATVFDALRELSSRTGARLTPDRAIVDEPVMASATGAPARVVLEQMAKLLHYTWVRTGGTPEAPTYLLYQSRSQREEEDNQINGARKAVLQALQAEIERYRRLAALPPDQFQRELDKADRQLESAAAGGFGAAGNDPRAARQMMDSMALHAVGAPVGRVMMELLEGLAPYQWAQLQDEQPLVLSSSPAPGETPISAGALDRLRAAAPGFPFPKTLFKTFGPEVEKSIGDAEKMMQDGWSKASGFKVTVHLSLTMGSQPVGMLRVTPQPGGGPQELSPIFAISGLNMFAMPGLLDEPKEDPAEREKRLAADPVLGKKAVVKLPPPPTRTGFLAGLGNSHRAPDILPQIEEAFGVYLEGDAYNRQAMTPVPPFGDNAIPLYKVLDTLAGLTREWELDGRTIRLKSKTWAHDRRAEIPTRHMRRWLAMREKKNGLGFDDLAEIAATLRDEQIDSLMFSALEEGETDFTDFVMIPMNRDILRFWARLLPLQRQTLMAGRQIPARMLFQPQQAALLAMNTGKNQSMFAMAMPSRAQRTAGQLAGAVLSVERTNVDAAAGAAGARPGEGNQGQAAVRAAASMGVGVPTAMVTVRLTYPDGQKDVWSIPLTRPTAKNAPPMAPPKPVDGQRPE